MNSPVVTLRARHRTMPGALALVGLLLAVLALATLVGLLSALNQLLAVALILLVALPATLLAPRLLFWAALLGPLVIVGLLELYVPGLQFLRHLFPLAGALFFFAMLMSKVGRQSTPLNDAAPIVWSVVFFVAVAAGSTFVNWKGGVAAAAGIKNYFQAWGLLLGILLMAAWPGLDRRVSWAFLGVALLQLPFVLHQFFFLVPLRQGQGIGAAVDIVAGTLGGSVLGGGQNAFLGLFLSTVAGVLLAMWRHGAVKFVTMAWLLPVVLLPLLLNSSRVSLVYAVLVFLLVFRREILRRPMRVLVGILALGFAVAGLLYSYLLIDQQQYGKRFETVGQLIDHVITSQTAEDRGYGTLTLNRTTALTFWAEETRRYPLPKVFVGHGLSASKEGEGKLLDTSNNLASRVYPGMGIGLITVTSLLWDLGILGLLAGLALPMAGFVTAGRLARKLSGSPFHAGLFEGLQAACVLVALSFFHKSSFSFHLGYQTFLVVLLGFLAYAGRYLTIEATTAATTASGARGVTAAGTAPRFRHRRVYP